MRNSPRDLEQNSQLRTLDEGAACSQLLSTHSTNAKCACFRPTDSLKRPSLPQDHPPRDETRSSNAVESNSPDSDFEAREKPSTRRVRWASGTKSPSPPLQYEQPIAFQDGSSSRTMNEEVHHLELFRHDSPRDESERDDSAVTLGDLEWLLSRKASSNEFSLDWILNGAALPYEEEDFLIVFVDVFD
mmetsp:Transcript_11572/g.27158  ORF Transcript_11572/g.27158 Transcript_11572/m.27158 type:complete len:188 (-) Transcript_11572:572-1135(-)